MTPIQLPIHSDPEIMGGTPVFVGTRVPGIVLEHERVSSVESTGVAQNVTFIGARSLARIPFAPSSHH